LANVFNERSMTDPTQIQTIRINPRILSRKKSMFFGASLEKTPICQHSATPIPFSVDWLVEQVLMAKATQITKPGP
jgi:hypothetical protein